MDTEIQGQQLRRLVCGLADQDIKAGKDFFYDGGKLLGEDVAEMGLPSILCLADRLSEKLNMGSLGYRFTLGEGGPVFPLAATPDSSAKALPFAVIAPFVYDVFMHDVRECRHDLATLFERAARVLDPEFSLVTRTVYAPSAPALEHVDAEHSHLSMGH